MSHAPVPRSKEQRRADIDSEVAKRRALIQRIKADAAQRGLSLTYTEIQEVLQKMLQEEETQRAEPQSRRSRPPGSLDQGISWRGVPESRRLIYMGWTVGLCILLGGPHLAVSWGLIDCARDEEYLLININGLRPTIAQQEMMVMVTAALALLVFVGVLWRRARRPQAAVEPATAGRQQASERRSGVAGLIPALIAQGVLVGAVPLAPLLLGSTHYWMDVPVGFVTIVELSTMGAAAFFVRIPDSLWKRLCLFPIAGLAATAPFFFISLILFAVTHFPTP